MLPSNARPTISPCASISGLPELPPTMSLLVEKLNGVFGSSLSFAFEPALRHANGSSPVARSIQARQARERLDLLAVLHPALHGAVAQAQRERRVRIHARAERGEARLRDLLRRGAHRRLHFVLVALAHGADALVDELGELRSSDRRTRRRPARRLSTAPCAPADRRASSPAISRFGERVRRFLAEQLAHGRVVRAEPLAHALERERQRELLELRIDRRVGAAAAARCAAAPCRDTRAAAPRSAWRARRRRARACAHSGTAGC